MSYKVSDDYRCKMTKVLGDRYFQCEDIEGETWKPLSSWKQSSLRQVYYVSDKGRVKDNEGNILIGSIDDDGYHVVQLQYSDRSTVKHSFVHRLVLPVFLGEPPLTMDHPTVQHKDHNPLNNCLDNLEWMSRSDNCRDAQAIGIKIIDRQVEHIFESKVKASSCYCGKSGGYINDCMKLGIPITNKSGQVVSLYYRRANCSEWTPYIPSKQLNPWRIGCLLIDNDEEHLFKSIADAARYLGLKDGGAIMYNYKKGNK